MKELDSNGEGSSCGKAGGSCLGRSVLAIRGALCKNLQPTAILS
jgi:hypothetical protein